VFGGRVLDYLGQPLAKAAVLAYHADRQGLYNRRDSPTRVPRLRGVAVTDEHGRFEFRTVRPAAYPDGSEPAHVHVGVMAPAHHARYLDYWFAGDPLITQQRRREAAGNPNTVVVRLARGAEGAWRFRHDIRLQPN
jgi:protocatechuate 3,4-dioxygenase beta subunit